eukprot:SAG31_NODE_231_length_19768_cov_9.498170_12_plen_157_part_00
MAGTCSPSIRYSPMVIRRPRPYSYPDRRSTAAVLQIWLWKPAEKQSCDSIAPGVVTSSNGRPGHQPPGFQGAMRNRRRVVHHSARAGADDRTPGSRRAKEVWCASLSLRLMLVHQIWSLSNLEAMLVQGPSLNLKSCWWKLRREWNQWKMLCGTAG